ncbi:MAG: RNA polymerase sigma factor [Planctomycetota bacterium]
MFNDSTNHSPFANTRWSVVVAAGDRAHPDAERALEELCNCYWSPLYSYARRSGHDSESARDAVQGFFANLIEKRSIGGADPKRGRFRSYLLGAFQHYLSDERDRGNAQKRGGGRKLLSLNFTFDGAEERYQKEPAGGATPGEAFEREWALLLVNQVFTTIRGEYEQSGKLKLFEELKNHLTGDPASRPFAEIAAKLAATEGAVKVAAHRLRERFRERLRNEVAQTVKDHNEIDDEIRSLMNALAR